MERDRQVLEIPYGTRDFLPTEAMEKRAIEEQLAALFSRWGYSEVVTPTIEYLDTMMMGSDDSFESHLFKLVSRSGDMLSLRHEMTIPIARLAASRLRDHPLPLKLSYHSNVFRYEEMQAGRQCEFYQSGVELMGASGPGADAEVIALAIAGLVDAGLKDFTVCIGQVEFVSGLMEQYQLEADVRNGLKDALEKHDLVRFDHLIDTLSIPAQAAEALKKIPLLNGGEELLTESYALAISEKSRRALDDLSRLFRLLKAYGVEKHVRFDLGIIRDFNYYTGMVFEIYTAGLGFPIVGGGRYDRLLSDFGNPCPATGFAIGIERILLALTRQGLDRPKVAKDVYVSFAPGKEEEAIQKTEMLRKAGKVVELSPSSETESAAEAMKDKKGYQELVYLI